MEPKMYAFGAFNGTKSKEIAKLTFRTIDPRNLRPTDREVLERMHKRDPLLAKRVELRGLELSEPRELFVALGESVSPDDAKWRGYFGPRRARSEDLNRQAIWKYGGAQPTVDVPIPANKIQQLFILLKPHDEKSFHILHIKRENADPKLEDEAPGELVFLLTPF